MYGVKAVFWHFERCSHFIIYFMVRSDEEIKKIIVEELTRDKRIDASKIRAEVKNSKVTLSGEVPSAIA